MTTRAASSAEMTLWRLKKLPYLSGSSVVVRVSMLPSWDRRQDTHREIMCKASPGWRSAAPPLERRCCRVQALRRDGVRLTIYANDPSPTVEIITWASDSMADLDPLGYLLILLALSHRSEWCQMSPTDGPG